MNFVIPRGRISHPISTEISDLVFSIFFKKSNPRIVNEFEVQAGEFLNTSPMVFFPYARTAFFAILELLDLPAGSKILMPTITIKPMLDIALEFGLEPIFVDIDVNTGCWQIESLEIAVEKEPSLALLTYLFGVVPNLDEILTILGSKGVTVIEDFSQAFGASFRGKCIGTFGDFSFCSISSTKTMDTYGGALVFAKDEKHQSYLESWKMNLTLPKRTTLLRKIFKNLIRNLATNKVVFNLLTFPLLLIVNSKSESQVGKFTGERTKKPISAIPRVWFEAPLAYQAKVGLRELRSQKAKDDCRIGIAERYRAELETQGPRGNRESISVYWQFIVVQENAIRFRKYLNSRAIDCATTSLVNISELEYYGFNFNLPGTKKLYETGVYLPCYHQLTPREQSRIIEAVKGFCEQPE